MRADRRGFELFPGERKAAFESGEAVLEVRQLSSRHEIDRGEQPEPPESLVMHQRGLLPVVVHTEAGSGVAIEIHADEALPELVQSAQRPAPHRHRHGLTALRTCEFSQHLPPGRLHSSHPFMGRGEHRLGRGEVGGGGADTYQRRGTPDLCKSAPPDSQVADRDEGRGENGAQQEHAEDVHDGMDDTYAYLVDERVAHDRGAHQQGGYEPTVDGRRVSEDRYTHQQNTKADQADAGHPHRRQFLAQQQPSEESRESDARSPGDGVDQGDLSVFVRPCQEQEVESMDYSGGEHVEPSGLQHGNESCSALFKCQDGHNG